MNESSLDGTGTPDVCSPPDFLPEHGEDPDGFVPADTPGRSKTPPPKAQETRRTAHRRLLLAVETVRAAGSPTPCVVDPEGGWTSREPIETVRAATLCRDCPLIVQCRRYVEQWPEPAGVWGGLTAAERSG